MSEDTINAESPLVSPDAAVGLEIESIDRNHVKDGRNGAEQLDTDSLTQPPSASKRRKMMNSISSAPEGVSNADCPALGEASVGKVRIKSFASTANHTDELCTQANSSSVQQPILENLNSDHLGNEGTTSIQNCVSSAAKFIANMMQNSSNVFVGGHQVGSPLCEAPATNEADTTIISFSSTDLDGKLRASSLDEKPVLEKPDKADENHGPEAVSSTVNCNPQYTDYLDKKPAVDEVECKMILPDPDMTSTPGVLVKTELDLPVDVKLEPEEMITEDTEDDIVLSLKAELEGAAKLETVRELEVEEEYSPCASGIGGPLLVEDAMPRCLPDESHTGWGEMINGGCNIERPTSSINSAMAHCQCCFFSAPNHNVVARHQSHFHNETSKFQCFICAVVTGSTVKHSSLERLANHFTDQHRRGRKFQCSLCLRCFNDPKLFSAHLEMSCVPLVVLDTLEGVEPNIPAHDASGSKLCEYCQYRTTTDTALAAHVSHFHCEKYEFQCFICPQLWGLKVTHPSLADLGYHFAGKHLSGGKSRCPRCGRYFRTAKFRNTHLKETCPLRDPFACSKCRFTFKTLEELEEHTEERHTKQRPVVCHLCNKTIKTEKGYMNHMAFHSGVKHKCNVCPFESHVLESLEIHFENTAHNGTKCNTCQRWLSESAREMHTKWRCQKSAKIIERKWVCDRPGCGRAFLKEKSLQLHLKYHDIPDDKWLSCMWESCPFQTLKERSLKRHYARTRHHKPHKCVPCDLPFTNAERLEEHKTQYHTGKSKILKIGRKKRLLPIVEFGSSFYRPVRSQSSLENKDESSGTSSAV